METIDKLQAIPPLEGAIGGVEEGETALLKTETGLYVLVPIEGGDPAIPFYLQQLNCSWITSQKPEWFTHLRNQKEFSHITNDVIEVEHEIYTLNRSLDRTLAAPKETKAETTKPLDPQLHTSLFSLAKTVYQHQGKGEREGRTATAHSARSIEPSHSEAQAPPIQAPKMSLSELHSGGRGKSVYKVEREGDRQGGSGQQHQNNDQQGKKQGKKLDRSVAKTTGTQSSPTQVDRPTDAALTDISQIFVRFMDLMARILGQAEAEAHELYQKIKHRTDQVDLLTTLLQKINNESGEINWASNPQMLKLLQQARDIGVEIPVDKTKWSDEEKRLLKENIQMRKDSMEKITQLERTDMQRYLQEASQCHQARSNVLKLLKEVLDTIIHNIRP